MKTYTDRFKRAMVQRMLLPNGPTATALAEEVGIPQPTLSRWVRTLGTAADPRGDRTAGRDGLRGLTSARRGPRRELAAVTPAARDGARAADTVSKDFFHRLHEKLPVVA